MFMAVVWISFDIGVLMTSKSESYFRYCDTLATYFTFVIARDLSCAILIYYSLSRCRQLLFTRSMTEREAKAQICEVACCRVQLLNARNEAQRDYDSRKSWYNFVPYKGVMSWKNYLMSRKTTALFLVCRSSVAVQLFHIADAFGKLASKNQDEQFICSFPSVDLATRAISISKLTLETLTHIVYSFGASTRNKVLYCIRNTVLALTAVSCVTILFLMQLKRKYRPNYEGFLVWTIPLWSTVGDVIEVSHAFVIFTFGCSNL